MKMGQKPKKAEGTKHDQEKIQLELLSSYWINGVGQVLTFGAKKYAAHNWRKGISQSRLMGACLRHIFAYLKGEDLDPETGLSHLWHASCCLMFASELLEQRPDLDDRYKIKGETEMTYCSGLRCRKEKQCMYWTGNVKEDMTGRSVKVRQYADHNGKCDHFKELPKDWPVGHGAVCKGSYILGTACGRCARCEMEKKKVEKD